MIAKSVSSLTVDNAGSVDADIFAVDGMTLNKHDTKCGFHLGGWQDGQ